jgi:hypothetical protein
LLVVLRVYLRAVVGGFEAAGSSRREAAILLLAADVLLVPLQRFRSTSARKPVRNVSISGKKLPSTL